MLVSVCSALMHCTVREQRAIFVEGAISESISWVASLCGSDARFFATCWHRTLGALQNMRMT